MTLKQSLFLFDVTYKSHHTDLSDPIFSPNIQHISVSHSFDPGAGYSFCSVLLFGRHTALPSLPHTTEPSAKPGPAKRPLAMASRVETMNYQILSVKSTMDSVGLKWKINRF